MSSILIRAGRALTPLQEIRDAAILIEDEKIIAVGPRDSIQCPPNTREVDAWQYTVVPGFVDVHIHGAGGHDVMEGQPNALETIAATAARFGTTSLIATTMTAELSRTCKSLEGIGRFISSQRANRPSSKPTAQFLGIHFEGPFISHARRGIHPSESIAAPSAASLQKMLDASGDWARIITMAPEPTGALQLLDYARSKGLVVALGHTDATFDQSQSAIRHGASHATHIFNAMRPFSHRETGIIGAALTSLEMTAEVIADGVHVDDPAIRLLLAAKGVDRVLLVSDATSAAGMPDGKYMLATVEVTVSGGVCRGAEGNLAGSTLTLDRAIRNIVALGVPLQSAVQMATLNPARLIGMEKQKGVLAPDADADLVLLDQNLNVTGTMTRGVGLLGF